MDELMRYRVTGALFLFALAVIVLPMIFDGDGLPAVTVAPIEQPVTTPTVARIDDVAPPSDYLAQAEALREQVDADGYATATGTRVGQPVLTNPTDATSVWAVQTGSFAERDNAVAFRNNLREAGYEAFLSTVKTADGLRHRVAVGPFLDEHEAELLAKQLSSRFETSAQLKDFST